MSSLTERGHGSQSQQSGLCMCVCVKSEVFKAEHAGSTHALWIPDQAFGWTVLGPVCTSEFVRVREERETGSERGCVREIYTSGE